MGSFLSGLFGGKKQTQQPAAALRITTSLQGIPLPWLLGGQQRVAGNLIWYGAFQAVPASSSAGGGGKGGLFSGGSAASGYNYYASFMLAACEGPDIASIVSVWVNGVSEPTDEFGLATLFLGTYTQDQWPYGLSFDPLQMLYYRGLCYAAFGNYPLGSSPGLPQINLEVLSTNSNVIAGQPDGDPSVCWTKFFTDQYRGLGFPTYRMGSLTSWQQYSIATGMLVSPALASAVTASSFAKDLLDATNSNARWSAGLLTVIPYGDQQITAGTITPSTEEYLVGVGNGSYDTIEVEFAAQFVADDGVVYTATGMPLTRVFGSQLPVPGQYNAGGGPGISPAPGYYVFHSGDAGNDVTITYTYAEVASYTPNVTPIYSLTLDNFLANQGTIGQGVAIENSPLIVVRKPRDQMLNVVKLTYLDRNNSYNPVTIEVKNEASLQAYGRWRADSAKTYDFFCLAAAAQQSAALQLQRQQIARTFQFTLGKQFILIDVMDLVEVSDPAQGISNQAVRITEIQENTDSSLTFTAEEFLGTASAPLYNIQGINGFIPSFNEAPGNANPPIIFEPTDELGGGLFVWAAVSGQVPSTWGGCNVWVSTDGTTYQQVGQILGVARMGVTTSDFPTVTVNPAGQTIDQVNTLAVNLTQSVGALSSVSTSDALALNTACYVGPINGGGEIVSYATATLTSAYNYGLTYLVRGAYGTEAEIVDHPSGSYFARLDNEIAKIPFNQNQIGSTISIKLQGFNPYQGGLQELSECTAYTYTIQGSALTSPLPNVTNPLSVYNSNIGFTQLVWDYVDDFRSPIFEVRVGASWNAGYVVGRPPGPPFTVPGPGTYWISAYSQPVNGVVVYSETPVSVVVASGVVPQNNILSVNLASLNFPGTLSGSLAYDAVNNDVYTTAAAGGTYFPSSAGNIVSAYLANVSISTAFEATGAATTTAFLSVTDFLGESDFLGSASTQFVTAYPIIRLATNSGTPSYDAWQKFTPGSYACTAAQLGMVLSTSVGTAVAVLPAFSIIATLPPRVDTYDIATTTGGATTLTFQPTGAASTAPFNGGAASGKPVVNGTIQNPSAGDILIIGSLSTTSCAVEVTNAGSPVVRTVHLTVTGY